MTGRPATLQSVALSARTLYQNSSILLTLEQLEVMPYSSFPEERHIILSLDNKSCLRRFRKRSNLWTPPQAQDMEIDNFGVESSDLHGYRQRIWLKAKIKGRGGGYTYVNALKRRANDNFMVIILNFDSREISTARISQQISHNGILPSFAWLLGQVQTVEGRGQQGSQDVYITPYLSRVTNLSFDWLVLVFAQTEALDSGKKIKREKRGVEFDDWINVTTVILDLGEGEAYTRHSTSSLWSSSLIPCLEANNTAVAFWPLVGPSQAGVMLPGGRGVNSLGRYLNATEPDEKTCHL
ncbi:hypothetical protein RRG08_043944 [Elysia crispata]|uniref:Uncharacterized protein n=1 Tax=Elysia crispata TaxID=231223 RepID=A0AAE1CQ93_9GAST|nr:hypothetical protein RRG08_043944 [Elysia crispata]